MTRLHFALKFLVILELFCSSCLILTLKSKNIKQLDLGVHRGISIEMLKISKFDRYSEMD